MLSHIFIGKKCKEAGFGFVFHNHDQEFVKYENETGFDILIQNTDPALVQVEMDIYWVIKGGDDPVKYFKKYPGRFPLLHVKDMDKTPEQERTCVGYGSINFAEILAHTDIAGVKYNIVEHEAAEPGIQIDCMKDSYKYLSSLELNKSI
ncbi:MAG: sugar phosphate isomerase/epimerase family protein [Bacteroidales bacterium]